MSTAAVLTFSSNKILVADSITGNGAKALPCCTGARNPPLTGGEPNDAPNVVGDVANPMELVLGGLAVMFKGVAETEALLAAGTTS